MEDLFALIYGHIEIFLNVSFFFFFFGLSYMNRCKDKRFRKQTPHGSQQMSLSSIVRSSAASALFVMLIELYLFPIPSEASTYQLVEQNPAIRSFFGGTITLLSIFGTFIFPFVLLHCQWIEQTGFLSAHKLRSFIFPLGHRLKLFRSMAAVLLIVQSNLWGAQAVGDFHRCNTGSNELGLCTGGAFSNSRNPINISMYLLATGLFSGVPTLPGIISIAIYVFRMHGKILMEETYLESLWTKSYPSYKSTVPRYMQTQFMVNQILLLFVIYILSRTKKLRTLLDSDSQRKAQEKEEFISSNDEEELHIV